MIRVLIVDDDKLALMGLKSLMPWKKYDMQVIGEAANGQKALDFLETNAVAISVTLKYDCNLLFFASFIVHIDMFNF